MNKYLFYFSVSTKKQGEASLRLDARRSSLEPFFRTHAPSEAQTTAAGLAPSRSGKTIMGEFRETMSGKDIVSRPELKKAIALCLQEKTTLVVAKIDRFSTNSEDALAIYWELEGRLESGDRPDLDQFTLPLFVAIADRERELNCP